MLRRLGQLRRPRPSTVAIGVLALTVALAPFLPDSGGEDGAIDPASVAPDRALHATAGLGRVTREMQREIDAVVARGRTPLRATTARSAPGAVVAATTRCARFEGQQYCLHTGWTETPEAELVGELTTRVRGLAARRAPVEQTGGLDVLAALRRHAGRSPAEQARAERSELVAAARSVAKVWLLRHQVQGIPLPDGFLERHPEVVLAEAGTQIPKEDQAETQIVAARFATASSTSPSPTTTTAPATTVRPASAYPERYAILRTSRVAEQVRSYWCGPTSMQMIEWGWSGTRESQSHWARRLGTTTSGTAITDMVRLTNEATGWDRPDRAGTYITLDIADWTWSEWWLLQMRHIHDYRAPVILHPVLLKKYYPYLDDDASGHFQVGRGYDKNGSDPNLISYFEPWNQQRFDPSEPYISRVQWRSGYRSYRANRAHFQHNLGV